MPEIYKAKSLSSKYSDEEIKSYYGSTRFMSYEGAIQLFRDYYNLKGLEDKPIGYKVTNEGIEMLFE